MLGGPLLGRISELVENEEGRDDVRNHQSDQKPNADSKGLDFSSKRGENEISESKVAFRETTEKTLSVDIIVWDPLVFLRNQHPVGILHYKGRLKLN